MAKEWQELIKMTGDKPLIIKKVGIGEGDISIEGNFELPPLARLSMDDQVFVIAFVRSHGSIRQMEQIFGVSYPTIKNRLNKISGQLEFVRIESAPGKSELLDKLEKGEISVDEALKFLGK